MTSSARASKLGGTVRHHREDRMNLYHFTGLHNVEAIKRDGLEQRPERIEHGTRPKGQTKPRPKGVHRGGAKLAALSASVAAALGGSLDLRRSIDSGIWSKTNSANRRQSSDMGLWITGIFDPTGLDRFARQSLSAQFG
jgi:hypothetical protein